MESTQRRGLTLVLPPLVGGKLVKKLQEDAEKPKVPRPVKLKPLKEVLVKLIVQFKK
jgi:bromodomain-containing protein 7/9